MKRNLVYDLPTRLFHWSFVFLFIVAYVIGNVFDDDSPIYAYHMLAGLTLGFVVLLRIIWGFIGSRHARWSQFALNPVDLIQYFKGILSGSMKRWAGHNPASSWAAIIMIVCAIGLATTGYLMTGAGLKHQFEEIHEILANVFLFTAIAHVAGIILHTLRHKEMIGLAMVSGKKDEVPENEQISSAHHVIGFLFIVFILSFAGYLYKNYDAKTSQLSLFGQTLQLGENENEEEGQGEGQTNPKVGEETGESEEDDDND